MGIISLVTAATVDKGGESKCRNPENQIINFEWARIETILLPIVTQSAVRSTYSEQVFPLFTLLTPYGQQCQLYRWPISPNHYCPIRFSMGFTFTVIQAIMVAIVLYRTLDICFRMWSNLGGWVLPIPNEVILKSERFDFFPSPQTTHANAHIPNRVTLKYSSHDRTRAH